MDGINNTVVAGKYGVSESSEIQLQAFFIPLLERGLNPLSCTVDGNPQAIKFIRLLWPDIIIQRCLVHIQRQGLSWCRRSPKTSYGKELRELFLKVTYIKTKEERNAFLEELADWEKKHGQHIAGYTERGRVFSDIKRARSMILKALPDMFHYLDDQSISFSTNALEGYFSRLKSHYRQHRGISHKKLDSYFDWYLGLKFK